MIKIHLKLFLSVIVFSLILITLYRSLYFIAAILFPLFYIFTLSFFHDELLLCMQKQFTRFDKDLRVVKPFIY